MKPYNEPEPHPIDRNALKEWTDAKLKSQKIPRTGDTHAEGFERCVTHVSFDEFVNALRNAINVMFQHLNGKSYNVHTSSDGAFQRSSIWVYQVAMHHKLLHYPPDDSELENIVLFDDMLYSGNQMADRIKKYHDVNIYVVVPFLSKRSFSTFSFKLKYATRLYSCKEYYEIHPNTFFNLPLYHPFETPHAKSNYSSLLSIHDWIDVVKPVTPSVDTENALNIFVFFDKIVDSYMHCMDDYKGAPDKSLMFVSEPTYSIYFDHKLADYVSTPWYEMNGFITRKKPPKDDAEAWFAQNYHPFIEGCKSRVDKCPIPPYA